VRTSTGWSRRSRRRQQVVNPLTRQTSLPSNLSDRHPVVLCAQDVLA
jgi:hypothetical protein